MIARTLCGLLAVVPLLTCCDSGTLGVGLDDDDSASIESCEDRYQPDLICDEADDECTFYMALNGGTCEDYCEEHGGICLAAAADSYHDCDVEESRPCDEPASDMICTCTLDAGFE